MHGTTGTLDTAVAAATFARPLRTALVLTLAFASTGCANRERLTAPGTGDDPGWSIARPTLTVRTASSTWTSPLLPGAVVHFEVPADQRLAFLVDAALPAGSDTIEFRWVLDPLRMSLECQRPRFECGWSEWLTHPVTIEAGPYPGGTTHSIVVESRNAVDERSRVTIMIHVIGAGFERELLIVDDTRLAPDEVAPGTDCVKPPGGVWPTAAELDTFLFARGGVPWRCYPAGTVSSPGLFSGYTFDTLGTNTGATEPAVRLEQLNEYRHVIWIVDPGAARAGSPLEQSVLRYMSESGRLNTLYEYVLAGGKAWLLGGGGAQATMLALNSRSNDVFALTLSNAAGELVPGTFMYDLAHWRSEFQAVEAQASIHRHLGRSPVWPGAPDYARLPLTLRPKSAADPPLPGRYRSTLALEFLSAPNVIVENSASTLDTLYRVESFQLPPTGEARVAMTLYHGVENGPLVFSGFDIWSFTRDDCQALVDFVLQDVWGLVRQAPVATPIAARP